MDGSGRSTGVPIMQLQQRIGNQAMQQLIQDRVDSSTTQSAQVQAIRFGPYAPQTYGQLLSISLTLSHELRNQLEDV
jgi:S-adenosylmethionine synthetase